MAISLHLHSNRVAAARISPSTIVRGVNNDSCAETEFLEVIGTKSKKFSLFVFTVTSTNGFYSAPPRSSFSKSGLELACNVKIV